MAFKHLIGRAAALITVSLAAGFVGAHVGATPQSDLSAKLTIVPKGGSAKAGYYMPQRLMLSATKPAEVKKEPTYVGTPMYGILHFGDAKENGVLVVLDENADGSIAKLYVDSNHDGDLTNDAPIAWTKNAAGVFMGSADVEPRLAKGNSKTAYELKLYRFAPDVAKQRNLPKDMLLYYRDYAATGEVTLDGKTYPIVLLDDMTTGHFDVTPDLKTSTEDATGKSAAPSRKVTLLIDRDGDGKFDRHYEMYDISKPFNISGKTYEMSHISADGTRLSLKVSSTQVAEIPIPPPLGVGKPAIAFSRETLTGKTVSFPGDYKGKVVMLDFWATWCGPCRAELPGLVKAYEKYHDKGFEVLGISLDQEKQQEKVESFLKANNMSWPQVYDGKYWKADVAVMYSIDAIPHAFLVDGDTGKILANGNGLRGEALDGTIAKALAGKGGANNR